MIEEATITINNNKVKTIATTNEYQRTVEIAVELVTSGRYCRRICCRRNCSRKWYRQS